MSYDPMHAINYVNWYLGSAAGIGKDELGEHIKEANYRYVNRSSQSPEDYFAYCDSVLIESRTWFEKCHKKGVGSEQFEVCLALITSVYDLETRGDVWNDVQEIVGHGSKSPKSDIDKCKEELTGVSIWEDMSASSKGDLWMGLFKNNEALVNMGRGDLSAASRDYKESAEHYRKAGFEGHYYKTLALYFDNLTQYEHSKTDHHSDPEVYLRLQDYCEKARSNYDKALSYDEEKLPLPPEMSFYIHKGNPDLSGEIEYGTLTGVEAAVISSNSWAMAAQGRIIRANHVNHYALHKMSGKQQTDGLFEAAFQCLSAAHCSLFAAAYSQIFNDADNRISAYFSNIADYYWYKAEALQTADQMRESVYNLEVAKEKIEDAIRYYTEAAFGKGSHWSGKEGHDDYARKKISSLRGIAQTLGGEIFNGRAAAGMDRPSGTGKPSLKLSYEYLDKPVIGDVCNIKFDVSNHGTPISNVSAQLKNGLYQIEELELPMDYPPIKVANTLDRETSHNSMTAIYEGKDPVFVLKYDFEGETFEVVV